MTFTCDKCTGDYEAVEGTAVAHLYVKDKRCNYIDARCSHCGTTEVIFLGPNRLEAVIREGGLPVKVNAEADSDLRLRAERAWAAAEQPSESSMSTGAQPSSLAQNGERSDAAGNTLERYDLTPRHEELLATFGRTLTNIPDELFWDGLAGDHDRELPERWTD